MPGRQTFPWWPAALPVIIPVGLYLSFLCLCAIPAVQRNFLYAHRAKTSWWTNINKPEQWGFAKNQVTPFSLKSDGGVTLYAWHIMPIAVYAKHEDILIRESEGCHTDFTVTAASGILKTDPETRLVISFHGNAGHVAQGVRPAHYHSLTDASPSTHVIAIDYRGFGHSTGSPNEEGLIADATAIVDFALHDLGVPASRIVLLGHSLGTAVASAVAERYALKGVDFAGVALVAGFSTLPTMLSGYAIAGWVPVLRPLKMFPPRLQDWFMSFVADKWLSADRLAETVRVVHERGGSLRLRLVHAFNDWDIPSHEDDKLFASAVNALAGPLSDQALLEMKDQRTVGKGKNAFAATWTEGNVVIQQELFPHGGHNDILTYAPVTLAVLQLFESRGPQSGGGGT